MQQRTVVVVTCLLNLGLALVAVYVALGLSALDGEDESWASEDRALAWLAGAGLVPATLAVIAAIRGRGRAGMWVVATYVVYATWGVLTFAGFN